MDFQIEVNNRLMDVFEGETLLMALRRHGIRIPTLCHMNRFSPSGACRLCVVEVEGKRDLITSCSYPVEPLMKVNTNSQRVIKARKSLVELLLSNHPDDCLYCQRNGNCELQWLAEEMNVKERKYFGEKNKYFPDHSATSVARDPAKCILCSRCVRMCEEIQLVTAIDFLHKSNKTTINSAFNKGLNVSSCIHCGQCIMVCPTAALLDISHLEKVQAAIDHPDKQVLFMLSPAAIASVAEELGMKPSDSPGKIISTGLKKCGADQVVDLGTACDQNIADESELLLQTWQKKDSLPLFSSCCPSWVRYVETFRPEWIPHLARTKSPQQRLGACFKFDQQGEPVAGAEHMFIVSVTACVANKFEASREEMTHKGLSEVDAVLTTREVFRLIRTNGIDLKNLEADQDDMLLSPPSSAAWKMAYSGGKAEAVANEAFIQSGGKQESFRFVVPKNVAAKKESRVSIGKKTIGFAWISGIAKADKYIHSLLKEKRTDIQYVEVMACPGGCAGGGGQPINRHPDKPKNRKKFCQEMERISAFKNPGRNKRLTDNLTGLVSKKAK